MTGICVCCGAGFEPHPAVKNQQYCSRRGCQRARRRRWQREKLARDEAYRQNQAAAQQAWRARNPDYWRQYRLCHPEYAQRNRELQRQRNRRRRWGSGHGPIAKMDALVVKIDVIQATCPQGP